MQRQDPVGITIRKPHDKVTFTPDPQMLIMTGDVVFFSNETDLEVAITLGTGGTAFTTVAANGQSNGIAIPAGGPQVLGSSNQPFEPCVLKVADQLILIRRTTVVSFDPLFVQPATSVWVVWQNNDNEPHQPVPDVGTTWSRIPAPIPPFDWSDMVNFSKAGNYPYHCARQQDVKGRIALADVAIQISPGTQPFKAAFTTSSNLNSWKNTDVTAHEPIPAAGTSWPTLPGVVPANDFSDGLLLPQGNLTYSCKLHPAETGQVTVAKATSTITAGTPATYSAVTVTAGDYVNWNNTDKNNAHQPVPDDGTTWSSELPGPIAKKATSVGIQFPTPGTYPYHCQVHTGESGTIIVQPKS